MPLFRSPALVPQSLCRPACFPRPPDGAAWIAALIAPALWASGLLRADAQTFPAMPPLAQVQAEEHAVPASQRSLAPLDVEAFRQRHGQQFLFRLRLGADAGFDALPDPAACSGFQADWARSAQHERFERALSAGHPFVAGQALGRWQRLSSLCH